MNEENYQNTFFEKNDEEVSELMCTILLWITALFPLLFILSAVNVFQISFSDLFKILPFGLICTLTPTVFRKLKLSTKFIKHYSIIAVALFITLMASNFHIGIYMTYVLALALSCLYFDKSFTIRTAVIGYVCMVVGVYLRSGNAEIYNGDSRMKWFVAYVMGYTLEYIAMSAVFINLAKRARKLLENLHNTETVKDILAQCGNASGDLSGLLGNLKTIIRDTLENNQRISMEADKTKNGCESSLEHVEETNTSIQNMNANMQIIQKQTTGMTEIATESYQKTENYIQIMNGAVKSMEQIKNSSDLIKEKIAEVENCSKEIENFADMISGIAGQTNILALNASIEAARAGEHGRGFAIVANQVGVLAEECKKATQSINMQIKQMEQNVTAAQQSVEENDKTVNDGIREINTAKDEAANLLTLQQESSQKVKEVEVNLAENVKHQEKVAAMAAGMRQISNDSLEQVKVIGQAIEEQTDLSEHMKGAFEDVQNISDRLLEISMQQG